MADAAVPSGRLPAQWILALALPKKMSQEKRKKTASSVCQPPRRQALFGGRGWLVVDSQAGDARQGRPETGASWLGDLLRESVGPLRLGMAHVFSRNPRSRAVPRDRTKENRRQRGPGIEPGFQIAASMCARFYKRPIRGGAVSPEPLARCGNWWTARAWQQPVMVMEGRSALTEESWLVFWTSTIGADHPPGGGHTLVVAAEGFSDARLEVNFAVSCFLPALMLLLPRVKKSLWLATRRVLISLKPVPRFQCGALAEKRHGVRGKTLNDPTVGRLLGGAGHGAGKLGGFFPVRFRGADWLERLRPFCSWLARAADQTG
ncbi:hypothetical protein B0T11DRAFT_347999 [Plectosphaerella cucumerina]|uniref:Uncharacterized protein n=1 Tax=Plectosphaerella cucumerina TaxID=40658 RepID=A0A8K0TPD3_9PEZI|nr:hypothetical protein B0T11DRAFT_347999 [Plectosphaerella cucumerina]